MAARTLCLVERLGGGAMVVQYWTFRWVLVDVVSFPSPISFQQMEEFIDF